MLLSSIPACLNTAKIIILHRNKFINPLETKKNSKITSLQENNIKITRKYRMFSIHNDFQICNENTYCVI